MAAQPTAVPSSSALLSQTSEVPAVHVSPFPQRNRNANQYQTGATAIANQQT